MDRTIFSRFSVSGAVLFMTVLLVACATATPYQPETAGQRVSGGYSEIRLGERRYRVRFAGNTLTSRETVEGYLLYRAAELTVESGYDWFRITDHTTARDRRMYIDPTPRYDPWYGAGYIYWRPHWRYYRGGVWSTWHPYGRDPFWSYDMDMRTVERFEAEADILMYRGPMRMDEARAFDARKVLDDLGPTITRPDND
ncbi:CC0125/CC1285 family lipoprotein [Parasphingorhabdus sp.]|uniref:CC0125/CC1285 family lipoprotein n=1 Tax=Parasphingorhabdus sp. TaxID=2709688 RepID=UPI003A9381BA